MKTIYKKTCIYEGCKKEFETTNSRKFYCSDACQSRAYHARKSGKAVSVLKRVKCDNCGKEFEQQRVGQRFCCYECKISRYRIERKEYRQKYDRDRLLRKKNKQKEKRKSTLDERAMLQKTTGLSEVFLQAYTNNPDGLAKIIKYRKEHGLSKPCSEYEERKIGHIYIV